MSYANVLKEMNIAETRVQAIADAMKSLHRALSSLDSHQLKIFAAAPLDKRLHDFAVAEHAFDVASVMQEMQLFDAARGIDFDEFGEFAERLMSLVEEAAELRLPGAATLMQSVVDLYKLHPRSRLPLSQRVIAKAVAYERTHGPASYDDLKVRRTNKYVGAYRHLDSWERIGSVKCMMSIPKGEHGYENYRRTLVVSTALDSNYEEVHDVTIDTIIGALKSVYTSEGCACEHDCCGCVSYRPTSIKHLGHNLGYEFFIVKMSYSRNL